MNLKNWLYLEIYWSMNLMESIFGSYVFLKFSYMKSNFLTKIIYICCFLYRQSVLNLWSHVDFKGNFQDRENYDFKELLITQKLFVCGLSQELEVWSPHIMLKDICNPKCIHIFAALVIVNRYFKGASILYVIWKYVYIFLRIWRGKKH